MTQTSLILAASRRRAPTYDFIMDSPTELAMEDVDGGRCSLPNKPLGPLQVVCPVKRRGGLRLEPASSEGEMIIIKDVCGLAPGSQAARLQASFTTGLCCLWFAPGTTVPLFHKFQPGAVPKGAALGGNSSENPPSLGSRKSWALFCAAIWIVFADISL